MLNSSLPQNTHPLLMKSLLFLLKPSKFWCEIQVCFSWCHILVIFWSSINYQFFGVFLIIRICQFCPNLHDLVLTPLIFFGPRKPIRLVRVQFGCLPPSLPMSSWGTWVQQVGRSRRNYSEYMVKMDLINRFLSTSNPDISRPHLVGGLEHGFYFPFHVWDVIRNPLTFTPSFFRMVKTHHQPDSHIYTYI